MADVDLTQLRQRISAANLTWRVRAVPTGEFHALGFEPSAAASVRSAERLGTVLVDGLRASPQTLVSNRLISPVDLGSILKLRPRRFDWRDHGVIGPVTDQKRCGSCVSFATAGLVAAQAAIELGVHDLDLSEADQHFCSSHGASCGGWNNHDSLDQVRQRGIASEGTFTYMSAFDDPPQLTPPGDANSVWIAHCRAEWQRRPYSITNFTAHTDDDRKTYLSTVGPMICGFTVYQDFDSYAGGPYKHVWGNVRGGHAVLVVGYDDDKSAWICRNSWGSSFGGAAQSDGTGAGFFELTYGDSNIDGEPFYGCRGVVAPRLIDLRTVDLSKLRETLIDPNRPGPVGPGPVETGGGLVGRPGVERESIVIPGLGR